MSYAPKIYEFESEDQPSAVLSIELYKCGNGYNEYDLVLLEGVWPTDKQLVTICDGGDPARGWEEQMHEGGEVLLSQCAPGDEKQKFVRVFTRGTEDESDEDDDFAWGE